MAIYFGSGRNTCFAMNFDFETKGCLVKKFNCKKIMCFTMDFACIRNIHFNFKTKGYLLKHFDSKKLALS